MDLVGIISAQSDPPGLSRERWNALIVEHPTLLALEGEGAASVIVEGARVGQMCWSTSGANEIDVHGELAILRPVAWEVARAMGGQFVTLAELTSC